MTVEKLSKEELDSILAGLPEVVDPSTESTDTSMMRLLTTVSREVLQELMEAVEFQPGDVVIREGEVGDCMYLIWSGRVAVVQGNMLDPIFVFSRRAWRVGGRNGPCREKTPDRLCGGH